MNIEDQLELAAAAQKALEALHEEFMDAIRALKNPKVNGAEFQCVEGELRATCIGVDLSTKHRLIAKAGALELLEYTFMALAGGEQLPVYSIYLSGNKRVYSDPALGNVLCDMTNPHFASRVAPPLVSKLLASPIFAPRP